MSSLSSYGHGLNPTLTISFRNLNLTKTQPQWEQIRKHSEYFLERFFKANNVILLMKWRRQVRKCSNASFWKALKNDEFCHLVLRTCSDAAGRRINDVARCHEASMDYRTKYLKVCHKRASEVSQIKMLQK